MRNSGLKDFTGKWPMNDAITPSIMAGRFQIKQYPTKI